MSASDTPISLPEFIRSRSERFGERVMAVLGGRRLSYVEADASSARLARALLARGVAKGSRIGLLAPNGPDWIVGFFAAGRIGAVAVPINTFYKPRELGWVLRHADVDTLLTVPRLLRHDYLERLEQVAPSLAGQEAGPLALPELPYLRRVYSFGDAGRPWARSIRELEATADSAPGFDAPLLREVESCVAAADPLVVIYSSGSTAEPKGAVHSHGAVLRHSANLNRFRDLQPEDRAFSPMPFFWVGGFVFSLFSYLQAGACMLCEESFEPGRTLDFIESERATIVAGWPHYAKAMMEHPSFPSRDLSSVRSGNLYEILPEAVRPADPELRSNSLGMTETCGPHTIDRMDVDLPESLRGSFGRPVPGLEHKIVDPETGEELPPGQVGEICVRGYSLMLGLHKREREQTFDRDGFYHTGDAGSFDAGGHLFFRARLGEMIKTAGANVTPREVEVVLESLAEVRSAFVVGVPDPVRGQNVAAAVIARGSGSLDADALRSRLAEELSSYKVPRHLFFYSDGELPFTDSGKIDKRRLVELLSQRIATEAAAS